MTYYILQVGLFVILLIIVPSFELSTVHNNSSSNRKGVNGGVCVIGGGASGIFSAISAAEHLSKNGEQYPVIVLEATTKLLGKVKISGGGRCNVLHDTSKQVSTILESYPRGRSELNGLFNKHFTPSQAENWFTSRGVRLKTESDGRMFPITDSSQTIIDTLMDAASKAGVQIKTGSKVTSISNDSKFRIETQSGEIYSFDAVILATGSSPFGHKIASSLGHKIVSPVPSLFTLSSKHSIQEGGIFNDLSGLSVQNAQITLKYSVAGKKKNQTITQSGPLLITHHGLSGPAALRLSAFAAREFHDLKYNANIFVHWAPSMGGTEQVEDFLWQRTTSSPKKSISSVCPFPLVEENGSSLIPKRLWSALVMASDIEEGQPWGQLSKKLCRKLTENICQCQIPISGKGVFKEEFVTAGGVSLKEIDMKSMSSKICNGFFACGEAIDVDGITGGFNFMGCWSTGFIAGKSAAEFCISKLEYVE